MWQERFSQLDNLGYGLASDLAAAEHLRAIAAEKQVVIAVAVMLAALFVWLALRLMFARSAGRIRRLIGLWLEAKEHELRTRAGRKG